MSQKFFQVWRRHVFIANFSPEITIQINFEREVLDLVTVVPQSIKLDWMWDIDCSGFAVKFSTLLMCIQWWETRRRKWVRVCAWEREREGGRGRERDGKSSTIRNIVHMINLSNIIVISLYRRLSLQIYISKCLIK